MFSDTNKNEVLQKNPIDYKKTSLNAELKSHYW